MRSLVTSPKWWGRHLLVLCAVAACALLGRWQWDKAMYGSGDLVNLGYGLQWWSFAVLVIYGWYRLAKETVKARPGEAVEGQEAERQQETLELVQRRAPEVDPDEDPELAAYNAYLARLSARAKS